MRSHSQKGTNDEPRGRESIGMGQRKNKKTIILSQRQQELKGMVANPHGCEKTHGKGKNRDVCHWGTSQLIILLGDSFASLL